MAKEGNPEVLKKFGERVQTIRKEKGWTQEKLADESEIEIRQIGRIERGQVNTSISTAVKIAKGLGVNICELFSSASSNQKETTSI